MSVNLAKAPPRADFEFASGGGSETFSADISRAEPLRVIRRWSARDAELIEKIRDKGKYTLEDSVWALGIVTGENRSKVRTVPLPGDEPVLTGREIRPFKLLPPSKFLRFDPENFQQTAPEAIYRAPGKAGLQIHLQPPGLRLRHRTPPVPEQRQHPDPETSRLLGESGDGAAEQRAVRLAPP